MLSTTGSYTPGFLFLVATIVVSHRLLRRPHTAAVLPLALVRRYPQIRMPVSGRSAGVPIEHGWPFCRAGALAAALTPP